MTVVDTTIHHQGFSKRENLYASGVDRVSLPEIFCIIDPNLPNNHTKSPSSTTCNSLLSFNPIQFHNIIEEFKYSIDNRTCDINILNNLEFAINNGIDNNDFQLLNREFNKVFMFYNWPSKWYSRVLANAIFLSAYFRDSNLAISCSNCFKTFTLLDNFHLHSDVIFNSIGNSLNIAGDVWDLIVYKSIVEFSFAFIYTGSDSLWDAITSILYKVASRIGINALPTLSGDDLGLGYSFNGLTVSRSTIAIFSSIKGILEKEIKAITADYNESVVDNAKKSINDLLNHIVTQLPIFDVFVEDICKMSEAPENIIAVYIIRQLIKSSALTIYQLMIIGLWSINCSKAIYSKWHGYLDGLNALLYSIDESQNEGKDVNKNTSIISDKVREILGDSLLECDLNVLIQMEHLNLTNYQSHIWACLILMNQKDSNSSIFDRVVPYLTFNYSNQHSNKYFANPVHSALLYTLIYDLSKIIMGYFQTIILGDNQLQLLTGLQNFISKDPNLIDNALFDTLNILFSCKDYKVKLKLIQILVCCIDHDNVGDMIENLSLELLSNNNSSVRLAAIKTFHRIVTNYNYNLKFETIKQISLTYVNDTSKAVCNVALHILSYFFFSKFIETSDKYNIQDMVEMLLCHLQGRKSLVNYYNGLDFAQNPIRAMSRLYSRFPESSLDFWFYYLMKKIKTATNCRIKLLYVMHMFSDIFKSYYLGKIHELASLFRCLPMDDQTYHLLLELIFKNIPNYVDDELKSELIHFVNYDLKDNSNAAIQSKMKLCILCNIDVTSAVVSALDAIKTLSLKLATKEKLQLVDQSVKISIWKMGSILEYLSQISLNVCSIDPKYMCYKVVSDLLEIGLAYIGHDDNLLIIIISSICCFISHFDNIQHLDIENFGLLIQKSISSNEKLAVAVLVTVRKFYSLKFNNGYNKHADELGNLFTSFINKNMDIFLYKSGIQVRRLYLVILHGLISFKKVWIKSQASHLFACYILYPLTRDLCLTILMTNEMGSVINYLEQGMELIASNVVDIGREGQNMTKLTKSFKKLYSWNIRTGNGVRNFVKLVKNKLEGALCGKFFKPRLEFREKLIFVDLLVSFTMVICERATLEASLFVKEVKKLVLGGYGDKYDEPFKYYVYKRLQYLSNFLALVSKDRIEDLNKYVSSNESKRIRLFKTCIKMSVKLNRMC